LNFFGIVRITDYKEYFYSNVSIRKKLLFRRIIALFLAPLTALPVASVMIMIFDMIDNFPTSIDILELFGGLYLIGFLFSFIVLPISYFMMYVIFLPLIWLLFRSPPVLLRYCLFLGALTGSLHYFLLQYIFELSKTTFLMAPWYNWVISGMVCGIFVSWAYYKLGDLSKNLD